MHLCIVVIRNKQLSSSRRTHINPTVIRTDERSEKSKDPQLLLFHPLRALRHPTTQVHNRKS